MANRLSNAEIKKRMVELRNLRKIRPLYHAVKVEIRMLKRENVELKEQLNNQALQIAELQSMVFARSQKRDFDPPKKPKTPKQDRPKSSYRRKIPDQKEVTQTDKFELETNVCDCSHPYDITWHERYLEDIPLPNLTPNYKSKLVIKQLIASGICSRCQKRIIAKDENGKSHILSGQTVRLGDNARLLVCHLISSGLSYSQIRQLFHDLYQLEISSGEISRIIKDKHQKWSQAYFSLRSRIRAGPSLHIDETSWPIQSLNNHGYAWVIASEHTPEVCFDLAPSRGVKVAKNLLKDYKGVRISDNYGAYRKLAGRQQLCWVHLYRNIRDLKYNPNHELTIRDRICYYFL